MLKILFLSAGIAMIVCCRLEYLRSKNKKNDDLRICSHPIKKFSVSEYMERIEKAWLEIVLEREGATVYLITLWWGIDGLRINDDGSIEWVRRGGRNSNDLRYEMLQSITHTPIPSYHCSGTRNAIMSVDDQIRTLQSQIQANIIQQNVQIQNAHILAALQSPISQCTYSQPIGHCNQSRYQVHPWC